MNHIEDKDSVKLQDSIPFREIPSLVVAHRNDHLKSELKGRSIILNIASEFGANTYLVAVSRFERGFEPQHELKHYIPASAELLQEQNGRKLARRPC